MPERAYLNCGTRGCHPEDRYDPGRPDLSDEFGIRSGELIMYLGVYIDDRVVSSVRHYDGVCSMRHATREVNLK